MVDGREARRLADLESEERGLSARRRRLHDRIDFARGGSAVASPDAEEVLAKLLAEERQVSDRRRALHRQIDELRVLLGQEPGPRRRERLLGD